MLPTFHTYSFFRGSDGSMLDFRPESDGFRFSWSSPEMDKVGTYRFEQRGELICLELEFNYHRERSYIFTGIGCDAGDITSFHLKSTHGTEWTFVLQ